MKNNFNPYKIGTIFNPFFGKINFLSSPIDCVEVRYPSRLNAMALDPSKITANNNMIFSPGEMFFSVKIYITVRISLHKKEDVIEISPESERHSLIKHSVMIMRRALGVNDGLQVSVDNRNELKHCGFGSSSRLISAVAVAINEMYGNPLSPKDLVRYLAQNHGEEIKGDDKMISPVQCIGGSASSGIYEGGLQIVAGQSILIKSMRISGDYRILIGVPKDFISPDSNDLLNKEIENFPRFLETGRKYGPTIAYKMLHEVLPAMENGDLKTVGDLIFEYRFKMGSIENCSFVYPKMVGMARKLSFLKEDGHVDVLSISSVGPAFFAVVKSKNANFCKDIFEKENLNVIKAEIENSSYKRIL